MVEPQYMKEIQHLVEGYARRKGFVPSGMRVVVTVAFEPVEPFDPKILDIDAVESFERFYEGNRAQGISRALYWVFRKKALFGVESTFLTIRDVVSFGNNAQSIDSAWNKTFDGMSHTSLPIIDAWLSSLGLHRGMKF